MREASDEKIDAQAQARDDYWCYIYKHMEVPADDSPIQQDLAMEYSGEPPEARYHGLCLIGLDLINGAVRNRAGAAPLCDAIAAFEIWLRAKPEHRTAFRGIWEVTELLRSADAGASDAAGDKEDAFYRYLVEGIERKFYKQFRSM